MNEFTITTALTAADVSLTASVTAITHESQLLASENQNVSRFLFYANAHLFIYWHLCNWLPAKTCCVHSGMLNVLHSTYLLLRPYGWNEARMLLMK